MKIIARNEEEKEAIVRFSRYLHDFSVCRSKIKGTTKVLDRYNSDPCIGNEFYELEKGEFAELELDDAIGGFLSHLHVAPERIEVQR